MKYYIKDFKNLLSLYEEISSANLEALVNDYIWNGKKLSYQPKIICYEVHPDAIYFQWMNKKN